MHGPEPAEIHCNCTLGKCRRPIDPPANDDPPCRTESEVAAFDRAIEEFDDVQRRMAGAIRRAGVHHEDAIDDAIQEAWLKALKLRQDGFLPRNPRAWLAKVARNVATNRVRRNREIPRVLSPFDWVEDQFPGQRADGIWGVVDALPVDLREVAVMRFVENREPSEIADRLDTSARTVYRRIELASEALARLLAPSDDPRRVV